MKAFLLLSFFISAAVFAAPADNAGRWWPAATETALVAAGDNRTELTKALTAVPAEQREGMQFLIDNMPPPDLTSMKAEFLLTHVRPTGRGNLEGVKVVAHLLLSEPSFARHGWLGRSACRAILQ